MVYLILLAPLGAMLLLVTMTSLERWQETEPPVGPLVMSPATPPIARGRTS